MGPLRAFAGLTWRDRLSAGIPETLDVVSYGGLGELGRLPGLEIVPCHVSALPALFHARRLPADVVLVQVAPPDADGRCSLGVGTDYIPDVVEHARVVIAEVNDHCPATRGASIPWERLDAVLLTSRPLLEAPVARPGPTEQRIAANVAEIVEDGDTIQFGVGALPEAILGSLGGHAKLGVHSGMISDGILDLLQAGVITGECKTHDAHLTVTGAALGSKRLFDALNDRDDVVFRPVSYTHSPATLAQVRRLCAINSALEVDLRGQVNAEAIDGRRLGAVGGQADFLRAAAAGGGKPIVALPAGRIVARLRGPVSVSRSDVDWVVTEHGAESLSGLGDAARKRALLRLAGPEREAELAERCRGSETADV